MRVTKAAAARSVEFAHNAQPYTEKWEVEDFFGFHLIYVEYTTGGEFVPFSYSGCTSTIYYKGKNMLHITKFKDGNTDKTRLKQENAYKAGPWERELKKLMAAEKGFLDKYLCLREKAISKDIEKREAISEDEAKRKKALERVQELGLVKVK